MHASDFLSLEPWLAVGTFVGGYACGVTSARWRSRTVQVVALVVALGLLWNGVSDVAETRAARTGQARPDARPVVLGRMEASPQRVAGLDRHALSAASALFGVARLSRRQLRHEMRLDAAGETDARERQRARIRRKCQRVLDGLLASMADLPPDARSPVVVRVRTLDVTSVCVSDVAMETTARALTDAVR